jgi:hypothetical protein
LSASAFLFVSAVARDPSQAIPLSGAYFGAAEDFLEMAAEVRVRSEEQATP